MCRFQNWHELRWTHRFDSAELHVDGVWVNSTDIVGLYRKLDLHVEVRNMERENNKKLERNAEKIN